MKKSTTSTRSTKLAKTEQKPVVTKKELVKRMLNHVYPVTHPISVLKQIEEKIDSVNFGEVITEQSDPIYKGLSLYEFEKGQLMNVGLPEYLQTFSIDLSMKLQTEYRCNTNSERTTAHLVAHDYCRFLYMQQKMHSYLNKGEITDMGVRYLDFLSKETDRAQRHYLASLQALQLLKMPPMQVTVKTNQANFAQNMVTQQGSYEPK